MKYNFYNQILIFKSVLYRLISMTIFSFIFGFKIALLAGALAFVIYLIYDFIFSKIYHIRAENKGFVLWFTGLPCSGKSTLADEVYKYLIKRGYKTERLDGDIVRQGLLCNDLGFNKLDRDKNINRVTFVAKMLSRNKVAVLASFISPYRNVRKRIKKEVTNYIEVYVKCSVEKCKQRDSKGMWELAKKGEIKNFTGLSAPYEIPRQTELIIDTEHLSIEESVQKIVYYLKKERYI